MKLYIYCLCLIFLFTSKLMGEQIGVPNTFVSGTKAIAEEVNENFVVLAGESNSQDMRISNLEALSSPVISDQLICYAFYTWLYDSTPVDYVQKSDPGTIRSLTYAQIAVEDWILTSVAGDRSFTYIFSK